MNRCVLLHPPKQASKRCLGEPRLGLRRHSRHTFFQVEAYPKLASGRRPLCRCLDLVNVQFSKALVTSRILRQQQGGKPGQAKDGTLHKLHLPAFHRPTRDELLGAASSVYQRIAIRLKWVLLRQYRPFNADDFSAMFSWVLVGNLIWVVVGTTTFFSLVLFTANTVFAQETLARVIGKYLTKETGINVVFESAIVPKWKGGYISFKNVFVSRHPRFKQHRVMKGSSVIAAAAAAAVEEQSESTENASDDENITQFDVTIENVDVTLSFRKWMNGKGLLKDVDVKGVRGVVDRRHLSSMAGVDPRSFRRLHDPGNFELDSFKLDDLLLTIHQPDGFRPYSISLFSCDLPQLRKHTLFYDFLSANNVSGAFDDSLFTIHPRQMYGAGHEEQPWKKISRLRMDGVNIDHLNRGVSGPFGWITSGTVDVVADMTFPKDDPDLNFAQVFHDVVERVENTVVSQTGTPPAPPSGEVDHIKYLVFDLRVQLNNAKAAVPLFNNHLSYVNKALIRPIVAYVNSRHTYVPVSCRIAKELSEFNGSWTPFDSGLMEDMSAEVYEAFARDVVDEQVRSRRIRKIGIWSLQLLGQMMLMVLPAVA